MKLLAASGVALSLSVGLIVTHLISKRSGAKAAINKLREGQLCQSLEDYEDRRHQVSSMCELHEMDSQYSAIERWYASENAAINEMYDEIINNL